MEIQIILIFFNALIFTIVDARSYYTFLKDKPVVDLNNKPAPFTPKLPHERRSAIFPKRNLRFVVDYKAPSKEFLYQPTEMPMYRPVLKNKIHKPIMQERKNTENLFKKASSITPTFTENETPKNYISSNDYLNENIPIEVESGPAFEEYNQAKEKDLSNDNNKTNYLGKDKLPMVLHEIKEVDDIIDVTTVNINAGEQKREDNLSVSQVPQHNIYMQNEDVLNQTPETDYLDIPIPISLPSTKGEEYAGDEEDEEEEAGEDIAEKYNSAENPTKRQVRSVNIIEEENLATTIAGFKFTGREPRVNTHLSFRNINS